MAPIWFITGAPGVGKTTVTRALAASYEFAFLIELDQLRQQMVSGLVEPSMAWSDETARQFTLAHRAAATVARVYAEDGVTVIVDHCSSVESVREFEQVAGPARVVCLSCEMPENLHRNRTRDTKSFDPLDIEQFVHSLGEHLPRTFAEAGYLVLDTTNLTADETVERLLSP